MSVIEVGNDDATTKSVNSKVDSNLPADPFLTSPPEGGAVGGQDPSAAVSEKDGNETKKTEETEKKKEAKKSSDSSSNKTEKVFPVFQVFSSPTKEASSSNGGTTTSSDSIDVSGTKKRRSSSSSGGNFVCNDPYKPPEMSPEATLMEFIATSASFHGVKKQDIIQLEWDILKVFTNNVMPANAAAWYMAKRRFYINNSLENQLLPFLLRKYPDKFFVRNQTVEFLDVYSKDVARKRMHYLLNQGLYAYFSHKADEYGVYFFDPFYYENTEPFHANLRLATNTPNGHKSKLIPSFFNQYKKQFVFTQHSPYLVSISKAPTKMKVNVTGIIVDMFDSNYGIIQFPSGASTEKALFCTKALYTDGWQYKGDPLKLNAVKFDGYMIQNNGGNSEYTWYAVLVWGGRKPSPKFCSTIDDLMRHRSKRPFPPPEPGSGDGKANPEKMEREISTPISPSKKVDDSMIIGEILEIKKNGAVVSMKKDCLEEKSFIPGWKKENLRKKGSFLTTTSGLGLGVKDLVGYYLDPFQSASIPYKGVAQNLIILKTAEVEILSPRTTSSGIYKYPGHPYNEMENWKKNKKYDSSLDIPLTDENNKLMDNLFTAFNGGGTSSNGIIYEEDSSDYDSFEEAEDISDGELNFLREGISDFISQQNGNRHQDWRSINFLQKVMQDTNNAINTRNLRQSMKPKRPVTPGGGELSQDSGVTSREVTPKNNARRSKRLKSNKSREAFWRMKNAFKCLDQYNSDDDPSYEPPIDSSDTSSNNSPKNVKNEKKEKNSSNKKVEVPVDGLNNKNYLISPIPSESSPIYWINYIMTDGIRYCNHVGKWIPITNKIANSSGDTDYDSDDENEDANYVPPRSEFTDSEETDDEAEKITDEEIKGLEEDLKSEPKGIPSESEPGLDEVDEDEKEEARSNDSTEVQPSEVDDKKKKENPKSGFKNRRRRNFIPYWAKRILALEPKVDTSEKSNDKKDEPDNEKKESEDEYDSDLDQEFYPGPYIMDVDLDYDEYSDAEIPDEELKLLKEEATIPLNEKFIGKCECDYVPSAKVLKEKKSSNVKKTESDKTDKDPIAIKEEEPMDIKKESEKMDTTASVEEKKEDDAKPEDVKLEEKKDEISVDKKDEENSEEKKKESPKSSPKRKGGKKKSK